MVLLIEVGFEGKLAGSRGGMQSYPAGRDLMTIEFAEKGFLMCSLLNSCIYDVYMYKLSASWKISVYMFLFLCMR